MRSKQLFISLTLGLGLTLVLLWLLGGVTLPAAYAAPPQCPGQRPLLQAGDVITVCLRGGCDYTSIQDAMDAAGDGDEILVASGVYTGVQNVPGLNTAAFTATQVVVITKTVAIRGGYTTTNWTTPYPITQPTTLDALGQGRVLLIPGDISPTIGGFRITGGNATGLGGNESFDPWGRPYDAGGGVYIINATATISNNKVFSNTAYRAGGLYLYESDATLSGNTVTANTASDRGGGLFLRSSNAILTDNTVGSNTAQGHGGGLLLCYHSNAKLTANTIVSNHAQYGGGMVLNTEFPTLDRNLVVANTASNNGGGLYMVSSSAILTANTVVSNTAQWNGGGLHLEYGYPILSGNTVLSNTAYSGGGLYLSKSDATLNGNTAISNTANAGGGLYIHLSDATLMNNFVAENQASQGSGLYIQGSSPHLLHTTIARDSGGSGLYVTGYEYYRYYPSAVAMTNTVLVSHSTGIMVTAENTVTLEATLWGTDTWANDTDWGGTGNIFTGTVNIWGDPAFVNPDAGDYHIGLTSAAIDKGVDAGVDDDIDGDPRPQGSGYDLGADEFLGAAPDEREIYLPLLMRHYQ